MILFLNWTLYDCARSGCDKNYHAELFPTHCSPSFDKLFVLFTRDYFHTSLARGRHQAGNQSQEMLIPLRTKPRMSIGWHYRTQLDTKYTTTQTKKQRKREKFRGRYFGISTCPLLYRPLQ